MSYAEFHLAWTGITPEEKARQQRTRAILLLLDFNQY